MFNPPQISTSIARAVRRPKVNGHWQKARECQSQGKNNAAKQILARSFQFPDVTLLIGNLIALTAVCRIVRVHVFHQSWLAPTQRRFFMRLQIVDGDSVALAA
jgi:hypothetical protein